MTEHVVESTSFTGKAVESAVPEKLSESTAAVPENGFSHTPVNGSTPETSSVNGDVTESTSVNGNAAGSSSEPVDKAKNSSAQGAGSAQKKVEKARRTKSSERKKRTTTKDEESEYRVQVVREFSSGVTFRLDV